MPGSWQESPEVFAGRRGTTGPQFFSNCNKGPRHGTVQQAALDDEFGSNNEIALHLPLVNGLHDTVGVLCRRLTCHSGITLEGLLAKGYRHEWDDTLVHNCDDNVYVVPHEQLTCTCCAEEDTLERLLVQRHLSMHWTQRRRSPTCGCHRPLQIALATSQRVGHPPALVICSPNSRCLIWLQSTPSGEQGSATRTHHQP